MIHAYQEIYVSKAQSVLGDAFDYAINVIGLSGDEFVKLFVVSTVSKRMETAEPACLAGKSGIEIAQEVILETKRQEFRVSPKERMGRSAAYWIGWAVAWYQWYSARSYREIFEVFSYADLTGMYPALHEADITKFAGIADERIRKHFSETNLKRIRLVYGCSQTKLAEISGVSLRSIQMYEQRNKNINKAGADTLYRLAMALGCTMEALIEK